MYMHHIPSNTNARLIHHTVEVFTWIVSCVGVTTNALSVILYSTQVKYKAIEVVLKIKMHGAC